MPAQTDMHDMGVRPTARRSLKQQQRVWKVGAICAMVMVEECVVVPPNTKPEWDDSKDALLASWEEGQSLCEAPQLFTMAGYTYSQQLAEQEYLKKETRSVKEIVLTCYHQYLQVFLKDASE